MERSTTNSISERPEPSTAAPGANWPPLRSMVTFSAPVEPLTTIVSVKSVVAAPHAVTPTMMRPAFAPVPTAIEAESPAALMLTVAVPAAKPHVTAAPPVAGRARATAASAALTIVISRNIRLPAQIRHRRPIPLAESSRPADELAAAVGADGAQASAQAGQNVHS